MNYSYMSETSDSDTSSICSSPVVETKKRKSEYKVINSEKRFRKFNKKYATGILIFHQMDDSSLEDYVSKVKIYSRGCKVGVVNATDPWCEGIVPASCKDHPYVQWYKQGKRISTPVDIRFQYARLIRDILGHKPTQPEPAYLQDPIQDIFSETFFSASPAALFTL
ncbi:hypothetical protein GGI07_005206 [Coemansia sp. Benny D115]|nr:hypothetical protein GGI07_005206 [Coemansia sp. Benny D115]